MDHNRLKMGIIASEERYGLLLTVLGACNPCVPVDADDVRHPASFPSHPQFKELLAAWNREGVDVALVDDVSFMDKEALVSGLSYYRATTPPGTRRMEVVFLADRRRGPDDEALGRLKAAGVRLIIPGEQGDVPTLVGKVLADVGSGREAKGAPGSISPREQMRNAARGKSIIAVAGIMPRSGATNCSIVLARTLVMLEQTPALIVDMRTGSGFRKGYRHAMAPDGKSFRVNGVDIYPGVSPSSLPRKYSHVVWDMGYLNWGAAEQTPEEQERLLEFAKADLQVVYVPCVSPADFEHLNRFFDAQSAADLERYAIGVWGATDELFCMLRTKFQEKAPDVFMWNVDVYRWPLSLGKVDEAMVEVLRPVLPRGVYSRAKKALRAASGEGTDGR